MRSLLTCIDLAKMQGQLGMRKKSAFSPHSMHCPEIGAACSQIDRGRKDRLVTVNSALPKASALDPQPVLGGVGVVSGRLYGLLVIA